MVLYNQIFILIIFNIWAFSFQNHTNTNYSYINNKDISIKNAIYIIRNRNGTLNLEYKYSTLHFINNKKKILKKNYEIIKYIEEKTKEEYFYIKEKESNILLALNGKEIDFISVYFFKNKDITLWKIIPKINEDNQLVYYVQNKKTKQFWELLPDADKLNISKTTDISKLNEYNEFQFIELYKEVNKKAKSKILEEEPIDVFIKYIDLSDPKLNRTGIRQIKKDEDNQELRYTVRSILKNIPWIRKIFILMPNEKVKYFKPKEDIDEKIVYVKDKDLLGFDSASIYAFLYNLHKMKQFGMSENFILMDDDYFIAGKLNKNDFFYEEKGKIFPALVTSDYYEMNKEKLEYKIKDHNSDPHSDRGFYVQQARALLFIFDIFGNDDIRYGKKLIEPAFSHNAIPVKMSDIEEIHDYILNKYEHANKILNSLVRTNYDLQLHTLYMAYVKNKYDRKVSKISSSFYDLNYVHALKWNRDKLFVINVSTKKYKSWYYETERKVLNSLFPKRTKYELTKEEEDKINSNNTLNEDNLNDFIPNISLIEIDITNKDNMTNIGKIKDLEKDFSIFFNGIEEIINTYENIQSNYSFYEDFLKEEIDILEKQNNWRFKINLFIICILFIIIVNIFNICIFRRKKKNKQLKRTYNN